MRKFLMFLTLLLSIVLCSSCNKLGIGNSDNYDTSDSAMVAEYVGELTNPHLMDVAEVLTLKQSMLEKQSVDSQFVSIPDNVLRNIVSVLSKDPKFKDGFTKHNIIDEYGRCRRIYDNLPKDAPTVQDTAKSVDKTGTDLGSRPTGVISNSYSFRTDTIQGKPVRIKIQTIESYEN